MRTSSKIFAVLFFALGGFAAATAIEGETHQWFIAILCLVIAFILHADATRKITETKEV